MILYPLPRAFSEAEQGKAEQEKGKAEKSRTGKGRAEKAEQGKAEQEKLKAKSQIQSSETLFQPQGLRAGHCLVESAAEAVGNVDFERAGGG